MALEFSGTHLKVLEDESAQIDFEGARLSGKTWLCCAKVVLSCLKHPGILWLICRYSNETTRRTLKPIFLRIAQMYGLQLEWVDDESAFQFPAIDGKVSKVYAYGLKSQTIVEAQSKVRGLDVAGIWNDQSEETPEAIAQELPFGTRQPDYPHQVIFSPNPPTEDHFLVDMFPEENPFENRRYYRVSLYENPHCPPDKLKELEDSFPPTHVKFKSLIMGMRGPNVVGVPVYEGVFHRAHHVTPLAYVPQFRLLEAVDMGKHHPVWMVGQRTPQGALQLLGGVMGKRMFMEDFLPVMEYYRNEWFPGQTRDAYRLCCDPPPSVESGSSLRYTHTNILREAGLKPVWRENSNAPDVRESVIQHTAGSMRRYGAFAINDDKTKWMMVSPKVTKQTKLFIDGCEGSYVWSENLVSVGNKLIRQPKSDQWVDGWQRCLENMELNFCTTTITSGRRSRHTGEREPSGGSMSWAK